VALVLNYSDYFVNRLLLNRTQKSKNTFTVKNNSNSSSTSSNSNESTGTNKKYKHTIKKDVNNNNNKPDNTMNEETEESLSIPNGQDQSVDWPVSNWCKGAIEQVSTHCCPIFDSIVRSHKELKWGTVLDAGSGIHSLEWIIGLPTTSWVAVTGDPKRKRSLESNFKKTIRVQDKVICGNWKDSNFLKGQVFDVVLADYLLGSVEGYAPYFQDRLFGRLKPHVGKRLYVTGAEPLPDKTDDTHGSVIIEIGKIRDAVSLLAGERPYREYRMDWVLRNLNQSGYKIISVAFFETTHSRDFVETQIDVALSKLHKVSDGDLAAVLQMHLEEARKKVRKLSWPSSFSNDYVVVAEPITLKSDDTESSVDAEELLGSYKSPVQNQQHIFPRDEFQ